MTISVAYQSTTGGISVNYRQNVCCVYSIVERESTSRTDSTCTWVIKAPVGRHISRLHVSTFVIGMERVL